MLRPCHKQGCPNLTREKYCEKHKHLEEQDRQERQRYYNEKIRSTEVQGFYESPAWRKLRRQKLGQMPLCEICYANKRITPAVIVDHKIEIKDGGAALDMKNLQSVCHACHNKKTAAERLKRNK
jgi:5-methylcytosine-specific restriction protein A